MGKKNLNKDIYLIFRYSLEFGPYLKIKIKVWKYMDNFYHMNDSLEKDIYFQEHILSLGD